MRDILKKVTTGAMIAGAALMVAACGGDTEANNVAADDLGNEPMMDANMDTGMDNMSDMNVGVDANVAVDANAAADANAVDTNAGE